MFGINAQVRSGHGGRVGPWLGLLPKPYLIMQASFLCLSMHAKQNETVLHEPPCMPYP